MSTVRFFSGSREGSKQSVAAEIMRLEVQKNGKLPTTERFRMIFKKRLQESRRKAVEDKTMGLKPGFKMPGNIQDARRMSKRAEQALKEIAAKKAAKEAKALRRMVLIEKRNFHNGRIDSKGKIYDIEGTMVGNVNRKNGKMATTTGWTFGKYKPKKNRTHRLIIDAIDQYSPYYIKLRKMQALQAAGGTEYGVWGDPSNNVRPPEVLNLHGRSAFSKPVSDPSDMGVLGKMEEAQPSFFGFESMGPRQNVGGTAWGARSDNVWGTYSDNAWGTSSDTVWGTNQSDVWGGVGGSPFGNFARTVRIWGSGNGTNHLRKFARRAAAFLGLHLGGLRSRAGRAAVRESMRQRRNSRNGSRTTVRRGPSFSAPRRVRVARSGR